MKSICQSLCFTTLLIAISSIYIIAETNDFTLERFECKNVTNSPVTIVKCVVKLINRTHACVDIQAKFNRTVRSIFLHAVSYYQYSSNEYRQSMLNVWEDLCGIFAGGNGNIIGKIIFDKIRNYTNGGHICPYEPGLYFVKMNSTSTNFLNFGQFLQAGRRRFEFNLTEGYKGEVLAMANVIFTRKHFRPSRSIVVCCYLAPDIDVLSTAKCLNLQRNLIWKDAAASSIDELRMAIESIPLIGDRKQENGMAICSQIVKHVKEQSLNTTVFGDFFWPKKKE